MSVLARGFEQAIKKGQASMEGHIQTLTEQNNEIIEKLNWVMTSYQKICDKLEVELDDPLEE